MQYMNGMSDGGPSESSTTDEDEPQFVRAVYVCTGPQIIADSKMRLAEWLERRGW